jgi:hypothetical protein
LVAGTKKWAEIDGCALREPHRSRKGSLVFVK